MYTNPTNPPDTNMNNPISPFYSPTSTTNPVTGTEKIEVKQIGNEITTKEKSSYHDPVTGVSETYKAQSKRERSRSRSNSSQRRRRNMGYQNQPMPAINQPIPTQTQPFNPQIPFTNPTLNMPMNPPMDPIPHQQPHPPRTDTSTPSDLYAHKKTTTKTSQNMTKTTQKLDYTDPITGTQENAKITTKVTGQNINENKSKHVYEEKVEDTGQGVKTVVKEKHREGGILGNIKNKIYHLFGRNL